MEREADQAPHDIIQLITSQNTTHHYTGTVCTIICLEPQYQ